MFLLTYIVTTLEKNFLVQISYIYKRLIYQFIQNIAKMTLKMTLYNLNYTIQICLNSTEQSYHSQEQNTSDSEDLTIQFHQKIRDVFFSETKPTKISF